MPRRSRSQKVVAKAAAQERRLTLLDMPPNVLQDIAAKVIEDIPEFYSKRSGLHLWVKPCGACKALYQLPIDRFHIESTEGKHDGDSSSRSELVGSNALSASLARAGWWWAQRRWDSARHFSVTTHNEGSGSCDYCCEDRELTRDVIGLQFPEQLQSLELRRMYSLKELPAGVTVLQGLLVLKLTDCYQLEKVSDGVSRLCKLRELHISHTCSITALPESISMLRELRVLRLEGLFELQALPALGDLTNLVMLDISQCRLSMLPDGLSRLVGLQHLNMKSCCNMRELPDWIGCLQSLKELELAYCPLKALPSAIGKLTLLECLHVGSKELLGLPSELSALSRMEDLTLAGCDVLEKLPDDIGFALTALKTLCLCGCDALLELPASIGGMTRLTHLELSYCDRLKGLPDIMRGMTWLEFGMIDCKSLVEPDWLREHPAKVWRTREEMHAQKWGRHEVEGRTGRDKKKRRTRRRKNKNTKRSASVGTIWDDVLAQELSRLEVESMIWDDVHAQELKHYEMESMTGRDKRKKKSRRKKNKDTKKTEKFK